VTRPSADRGKHEALSDSGAPWFAREPAAQGLVVDTSAIVGLLLGEAEAPEIASRMALASILLISEANWVEASLVMSARKGAEGLRALAALSEMTGLERIPVDRPIGDAAIAAWERFGKGRHPASLNFGDCFAYALSRCAGLPLLFKGDDFSRTDVRPA
jgi:ribonuclease VapC